MEKIKLVIWDLDETFWGGTLSEEGIEIINDHVALVKELTNRGIMNGIVSKNNFEEAKEKLVELNIWDLFIFPAIEWSPKGILIKNIIEECQLRDVNVLFLDDNHLNLKEAKFYNENLNVELPEFIPQILTHESFKGKDDRAHSRLEQYKILEKKSVARESFIDNKNFLESSNIKIEFLRNEALFSNMTRLVELLERTNQLNFTKIRSNQEEVEVLLKDKSYESALLRVKDDYGDYGIVGFYSVHKESRHLKHFTFSCRILNLGVAQYVYSKLKFPSIDVIPEIAEELNESTPDWIAEFSGTGEKSDLSINENNHTKKKILFKGGCDLGQMTFYLNGNNFEIREETNYVSKGNFPIHQEHTQIILDSLLLNSEDKEYIQNSNYLPFTDEHFYQSGIFDKNYNCLVLSVLMDYTNEVFLHKSRDIQLPFGGYYNYWTDENNDDVLIENYKKSNISITKETLMEFRENFNHIGQISPENFIKNLKKLRSLIPNEVSIIFINGTELESPIDKEKAALKRHIVMNKALDEFIEKSDHTYLLDVRKIINRLDQVTNNIRHYKRESYKELSVQLLVLLKNILDKDIKTELNFKIKLRDAFMVGINPFMPILRKIKNKLTS